ncbi:tRNA (adenosine(37)-N6)-threonylcarbamoyltransferase complex ATPase subunit type 1 TsaE [Kushneria phosphatilytica]|uniref:tRNA threonylcarbamoyladenosine biosynthesis protein TsaE n=1 Tax=Kushneria phosphatilytica TaxID=657387 RepID=A0A1S1NPL4_9GAMM|nr:tRNA (adenosine(37)-N6)-threonylcarbamoyltransferase complex ATPase subunit type 1 TsaE [Kushneria phosphatilytica]OHV09968.1 tRNA (adenosine(37)-N6)-threonylcarbamoyltransferase complex ATPase subunit type 1 TsaE [Kushneria phosphatilytica]QEL11648.1 tRNA (adenosine(37)-N6)-threonylcarbamoyltransferase complex ATPase subunit type 1 TsaE [Kushneria phosphatilytica]
MQRFALDNENVQVAFGRALAEAMAFSGHVWLEGELGAGKTTLARGVMRALGITGAVKSPTYTLVEPYEVGERQVYHFDLYRLADPEELEFIGAREWLDSDALSLVEWPSHGGDRLPSPDLRIRLALAGQGRQADVEALSPYGMQALNSLPSLFEQIRISLEGGS